MRLVVAPGLAHDERAVGVGRGVAGVDLDGLGEIRRWRPGSGRCGHRPRRACCRRADRWGSGLDDLGQRGDVDLLRAGLVVDDLGDAGPGLRGSTVSQPASRATQSGTAASRASGTPGRREGEAVVARGRIASRCPSGRSSDAHPAAQSHAASSGSAEIQDGALRPGPGRRRQARRAAVRGRTRRSQRATTFGLGAGSRPSRWARLRASLRARRTASAFSRAFFSEGFS